MGKRSKAKPEKIVAKSGKKNLWLIAGGTVIMICIVWVALRVTHWGSSDGAESASAPVTLIATLDPVSYTGKARVAYQVAKEIPEILAQLPCFCGCKDSLGHRSNLYCFADEHGSICDLCQNIALEAQEMHRKGLSVEKIRDNIRTAYEHQRM